MGKLAGCRRPAIGFPLALIARRGRTHRAIRYRVRVTLLGWSALPRGLSLPLQTRPHRTHQDGWGLLRNPTMRSERVIRPRSRWCSSYGQQIERGSMCALRAEALSPCHRPELCRPLSRIGAPLGQLPDQPMLAGISFEWLLNSIVAGSAYRLEVFQLEPITAVINRDDVIHVVAKALAANLLAEPAERMLPAIPLRCLPPEVVIPPACCLWPNRLCRPDNAIRRLGPTPEDGRHPLFSGRNSACGE